MNPADDRELETLLRRALTDEAGGYQPAGDGLTRIRARVERPGRMRAWLKPTAAFAAAAAVVAGVVFVPRIVSLDGGGDGGVSGNGPTTASATATASGPAAAQTPAATPTGSVVPGTNLPDLDTVWPYPSRAVANARADTDVRSGARPELADPADAALAFVRSFIGNKDLVPRSLGRYGAGIRILLSQRDKSPVTAVYLVRVRSGDDAPYVVVSAGLDGVGTTQGLALAPLPKPTAEGTEVRGSTGAAADTDIRLRVELREPGAAMALGYKSQELAAGTTGWSATFYPSRLPASTGALVVWATGRDDGVVRAFVAAPMPR